MVNICSVQQGAYGLEEVAIFVPTLISEEGLQQVVEMEMDSREKENLMASAQVLKNAIDTVAGEF